MGVVRRVTGGRAVLHGNDLTYCLAAPEAVLPEGLSLLEQPRRVRVAGSRPFDAEGLPTADRALVELKNDRLYALLLREDELAESEGIDLSASYAYSDSLTDAPMLQIVGHPVAVNPDKELREMAEANDWQIMEFKRPVTIRTRLATVPKPVPVISGAAVAGGLAAAAAVWVLRSRKAWPASVQVGQVRVVERPDRRRRSGCASGRSSARRERSAAGSGTSGSGAPSCCPAGSASRRSRPARRAAVGGARGRGVAELRRRRAA